MALPQSVYANLTVVPPARPSIAARRAAALSEAQAETQLKENVERVNAILDRLEARDAVLAAMIAALQKQKAGLAKRAEKIEDAVLIYMEDAGLKTLAGIRSSLRAQPAAPSLVVVNESLIPRQYMKPAKPVPPTPDKVAIKAALAKDDVSPAQWGCKLVSKISLIRK